MLALPPSLNEFCNSVTELKIFPIAKQASSATKFSFLQKLLSSLSNSSRTD